jgi:FtsH-binding integral membrane protein
MHFVTFIVALVFIVAAIILFSYGLVRLYQGNNDKSRSLIGSGFMVGLWGVVITAIIFGFFSL